MENLSLVYINEIGVNTDGEYEYEFFLSEKPELVWGDDWGELCPSACGDMRPDPSTYNEIRKIILTIPLACAQNNSCFSMQDCIDGITALAYENIDGYESYPEPYRVVFPFAIKFNDAMQLLNDRDLIIEK